MQEKDRVIVKRGVVLALLFIADRFLKNFVWFSVPQQNDSLLIRPYLNESISFSLPLPETIQQFLVPLLIVITILLLLVTMRSVLRKDPIFFWWGCIAIGAVSNILDRLQLGGVLDYISIWVFPVFNLSDVYITVGAGMIMVYELFKKKRPIPA